MKAILRTSAIALVFLGTSMNVHAADITWGDVNGSTTVADLIGGTPLTFVPFEYPGGNAEGDFFTGGGGDTGNADLNAVYNSHGWNGDGATLTLEGLTVGTDYMLQLLGAGDTRGCCDTRSQAGDDGNGNISGDFYRGNSSVVGSFTADAETQAFSVVSGTDNGVDPGLSGMILTQGDGTFVSAFNVAGSADVTVVPEPSSAILALCGLLGLNGFRRKR